jgi:putative transposase
MSRNRFRKGMHIEFRGRKYVFEKRLPTGEMQIKDIVTNILKSFPETELIDGLFNGQLEFLGDTGNHIMSRRKTIRNFVDDLNMLKDDDYRKKEAKRRYAYIKRIQDHNPTKFTKDTLEPLIEEVAQTLKDSAKPHWKTVFYDWFKPFVASGEDIRALVPLSKSRGNRTPKFTAKRKLKGEKFSQSEKDKAKEVAGIVEEVINEEYLNEQRLTVQAVYDLLEGRMAEINEFRDPVDRLPMPDRDSLYRRVNNIDEYEADAARLGKSYADHKHRCNKQGPRPTRPLERVEIDHTTLDLFVLDDEVRLPVGRPTLTVAIDKYSRMILGIYVSFDGPGYSSLMQCLLHAIEPKTYLKSQFPNVENSWNTYGLPELIVVDNGLEFHSKDFEDACLQLGATILYSPPRTPRYKASIERYFGTINRLLLHRQPGTTFSNFLDKKDYDPKKNALISFSAFMEMLHIWIVDIYHQNIHKGLRDIPAHVWQEGIAKFPPALPHRQEDLRILIGHVEHRTIGPSGIELNCLFYNSENLALLRRESKGEKVALKINPEDISIIYVYDHKRDKYLAVPALDQKYTKGLRLWQHEVIKNYARKNVEGRLDRHALMCAKRKIQEIVDSEWVKPHKSGLRAKMARWNGVRQQNTLSEQAVNEQPKQLSERDKVRGASTRINSGVPQWKGISDIGDPVLRAKEIEHTDGTIVQDDEALDMTGYSSSFELPKREA